MLHLLRIGRRAAGLETGTRAATGCDSMEVADSPSDEEHTIMSRRARRRKARKGSAANHGRRPNS
jgi:hypothetical protein